MESALEDPYEAAEHAVNQHDLEEQSKKKKIINELLELIEVIFGICGAIPTRTSRCSFGLS